jgi:hypothetical protein
MLAATLHQLKELAIIDEAGTFILNDINNFIEL